MTVGIEPLDHPQGPDVMFFWLQMKLTGLEKEVDKEVKEIPPSYSQIKVMPTVPKPLSQNRTLYFCIHSINRGRDKSNQKLTLFLFCDGPSNMFALHLQYNLLNQEVKNQKQDKVKEGWIQAEG